MNKENTEIVELSERMRTQDHRGTQYPLFVVEVEDHRYVDYPSDYDERERTEEVDTDSLCAECAAKYDVGEELSDDCEECDSDAFSFYVIRRKIDTSAGVFFTEKACEEHIAANKHHYTAPKSYVIGAWRNAEMKMVMQQLLAITGDIPPQYQ